MNENPEKTWFENWSENIKLERIRMIAINKIRDQGKQACIDGLELHDNPHCTSVCLKENYIDWCMGFCAEKQKQSNNGEL